MTREEFDNIDFGMPLDDGIRDKVYILMSNGFETLQSCQGGEGHACPEAVVMMGGSYAEGFKAYGILTEMGHAPNEMRRTWRIIDGELQGPYWNFIF